MFGSTMLDVAIGLVLIYCLLSLVNSAVKEGIESWVKKRAIDLERGIREILHDPQGTGLAKDFFNHPLICCLYKGEYKPSPTNFVTILYEGSSLPSYIPPAAFASALLDIVLGPPGAGNASPPLTSMINRIENGHVKKALLALAAKAQGDVEQLRKEIEAWFNNAMDRVAGWYKRWSQAVLFACGLVIVILVNADTIAIATSLSQDPAMRTAMVTVAAQAAKKQQADESKKKDDSKNKDAKEALDTLRKLGASGLPIGWNCDDQRTFPTGPDAPVAWLVKHIGWLLTVFAITLGAPFWFDLLSRFITIRASVKPKEEEKK
ncbi:MAG: hypothetical protein HY040_19780 [Planctomycetes bacterium]|nr:hypothetical protein [Planctomycetota bacterium]